MSNNNESAKSPFGSLISCLRHNGVGEQVKSGGVSLATVYSFADGSKMVVPNGTTTLITPTGELITKADHDSKAKVYDLSLLIAEASKGTGSGTKSSEPVPTLDARTLEACANVWKLIPSAKLYLVHNGKAGNEGYLVPVTEVPNGVTPSYVATASTLRKFGKGKQAQWDFPKGK